MFERLAIPPGQAGRGLVSRLKKFEEHRIGRLRLTYSVIREKEFAEIVAIERRLRTDRRRREAGRLRVCVRIERRLVERAAAGPEPAARDFVRVRFTRHGIRQIRYAARMRRRGSAGETGDGKIQRAKEQMYRAALADEPPAKLFEHSIGLDEDPPEALGMIAIVRPVRFVQIEADRVRNFIRFLVNRDLEIEASHLAHQAAVKRRYRLRLEREAGRASIARADRELVPDEIEIDLKCSKAVGNWRSGEAG